MEGNNLNGIGLPVAVLFIQQFGREKLEKFTVWTDAVDGNDPKVQVQTFSAVNIAAERI